MEVKDLTKYSFGGKTSLSFVQAIGRVKETLKEQGFGVLTEIDAKKVLKEKLDIDRKPYTILGACNPNFAHRALDLEPQIGALLPCNVFVYEDEDGGIVVSAMNPEAALGLVDNSEVQYIAKDVRERISTALGNV